MRMNPLAGQIQIPDFGASIANSLQMRQMMEQRQREQEIDALMRQHGAGIMAGEPNALSALAQVDPRLAIGIQSDRQAMELRSRADARDAERSGLMNRATKQDIRISEERLRMAREEARMQAEQHAAQMDENQRAAAAEEVDRGLAMLSAAQTPEQWDQVIDGFGMEGLDAYRGQFENREIIFAGALGLKDALERADGPQPTEGFNTLDQRASAAGLEPGSPGYREFMLKGPVERTEDVTPTFRLMTPEEQARYQMPPGSQIDEKSGRAYPAETKGTTTEGERKAGGFLKRMEQAEKELSALPPDAQQLSQIQQTATGWGVAPGYVLSPEQQAALQWQIDWVRSKIRWESGAVIGDEEAASEAASYFPRAGDDEMAIKAKKKKRDVAVSAMRDAAGREAESPSAGGKGPVRVKSVVEALDLPPGTQFIDPMGNLRVVPGG